MFSASAVMELADLLENAKKCTLTLQVGKEAAAAIQREREEADSKEKQDELDNLASTSFKRMLNSVSTRVPCTIFGFDTVLDNQHRARL